MYLLTEDNPNCSYEERVFSTKGECKEVIGIQYQLDHKPLQWWDVTGVDENGQFIPAQAVLMEDSGAGLAWLIFGGPWGLRFKSKGNAETWSLENKNQWGVPFKVLDISGTDIRFSS